MTESNPIEKGKIGVVTVTYNSEHVLGEFLDSLALQTHKSLLLYIVDNASKDKTLEIANKRTDLPCVILSNADNVGVSEGNNQGIRAALADGCDCVLLLNNDTVFPADMVGRLYAGLDRYQCEMTTCRMYFHETPNVYWYAGGDFLSWPAFISKHAGWRQLDIGQYEQPRRVTYAPTCCLLVRRTVFDRVGMMDPKYFAYFDDADFLLRSLQHGIALWYLPDAKLWHKVSALTSRQPVLVERLFVRNRIYFIRKHVPGWQARAWYWLDQCQYALSIVLFKSSLERWRRRRAAAQEGWAMLRE
jgi:GT2 family glycosyltransferase